MYSSPQHAQSLQDQQDIAQMQQLLAAGWQRIEDDQWLPPDDDRPVPRFIALQSLECITPADEAMIIDISDKPDYLEIPAFLRRQMNTGND